MSLSFNKQKKLNFTWKHLKFHHRQKNKVSGEVLSISIRDMNDSLAMYDRDDTLECGYADLKVICHPAQHCM